MLNAQEKMFLNRMADHMAGGLDMERAGRAVLAEDEAAWIKVACLSKDERAELVSVMASDVYNRISA